jgi:hypothetical protein
MKLIIFIIKYIKMIEGYYEKKLKDVTNKRILYFFGFKLVAFYICAYLLQKFISSFIFNWINFESIFQLINFRQVKFNHFYILKIITITYVIDLLKIIYFQKSEEVLSIRDFFAKIILFPGYDLFFFFANTIFSILFFSQIEYSISFTDKDNKNTNADSVLR